MSDVDILVRLERVLAELAEIRERLDELERREIARQQPMTTWRLPLVITCQRLP